MRYYLALLLTPFAFAQTDHFSFGVTAGASLLRPTSSVPFAPDQSPRYTLGADFQFSLNEHVSLRVNPTYRRLGERFGGVIGDVNLLPFYQFLSGSSKLRAHSVELPVIGQYTFRQQSQQWRPFLGAGFSLQKSLSQTQQDSFTILNTQSGAQSQVNLISSRNSKLDVGAVFSSGVEFKWKRLRYSPELRYTRWGNHDVSPLVHKENQLDALVSFRF